MSTTPPVPTVESPAPKPAGLRFVVPTTGGPVGVKRLRFEPGSPGLRLLVGQDFRPRALGIGVAPFLAALRLGGWLAPDEGLEVWLDTAIDVGESWHLPLALAVAAARSGVPLAPPDKAEAPLIFATGALDATGLGVERDYALATKLALAEALLAPAKRQSPVLILLPPDPARAGLLAAKDTSGLMFGVESLDEALARAGIKAADRPDTRGRRVPHARWVAAGCALAVVAGLASSVIRRDPPLIVTPTGPETPSLPPDAGTLTWLLPPEGQDCASLIFAGAAPQRRPATPDGFSPGQPCGFEWRVAQEPGSTFILPESLKPHLLRSEVVPDPAQGQTTLRSLFNARLPRGEHRLEARGNKPFARKLLF